MAEQPVTSPRTYLIVWVLLIALTATTVGVTFLPLGHWHTSIGLAIAVGKASLVIMFFMHALRSQRLVWIVIGGSVLWLSIMLSLTLSDYWTRSWLAF
jgi:cytochrome c oxidase subunit IV